MSFETRKLESDVYVIERTYKNFFSTIRKYCIRERGVADNILFAISTAFMICKKVFVYLDELNHQKYFSLFQIFSPVCPRYVVKDDRGVIIGYIKREFSLVRRVWGIFNSDVIRIASLLENRLYFFPRNYKFSFFSEGQGLGEIDAEVGLFSCELILNLTEDVGKKIDRRLALALVFLVDDTIHVLSWIAAG